MNDNLQLEVQENLATLRARKHLLLTQSHEIGHELIEIGAAIRKAEDANKRKNRYVRNI